MILSHVARPLPTRLAAVAATVFVVAGSASAQSSGPYIAPDVKGFRAYQIRDHYYHSASARPAYRTTTPAVVSASAPVVQSQPTAVASSPAAAPSYIAVRGPDGTLRYYPAAGTPSSVVVVNPGQPSTAQAAPAR